MYKKFRSCSMKRGKLLRMCLLLSFAFPIVNGNVCAKSSNEVEIEPSFNVKRRWYVVPKYFPYGEEPPYIFYEDKGFKGYLSIRSSFPS